MSIKQRFSHTKGHKILHLHYLLLIIKEKGEDHVKLLTFFF
jgi:hypothetical protein